MKNKDKKLNRDQKILGLCYLIFAGMFLSMLYIYASYFESFEYFLRNFINTFNYFFFYMTINLIVSLFIGSTLIVIGRQHEILFDLVLVMTAILVILDIIPIGKEIMNFLINKSIIMPWTILLFCFHSYLLYSCFNIRKRRIEGEASPPQAHTVKEG
jgi:hypothetical protein